MAGAPPLLPGAGGPCTFISPMPGTGSMGVVPIRIARKAASPFCLSFNAAAAYCSKNRPAWVGLRNVRADG